MEKIIMTGDEAVARGAWEAGCTIAAAYPGTPSTEILENIGAKYRDDIYSQWATNEKVAMEIAIGGSIGGARSIACMKHVGVNVAADPLYTAAYTGVTGGLVIVSADDPGCHSSQNEQDNRHYAEAAKLLMLEPADSQECLDYTKAAFELSEKFDLVVMIRMTTRVCHSKSLVTTGERMEVPIKPYVKNVAKYAMLPAFARVRHVAVEKALSQVRDYADTGEMSRVERGAGNVGVITSGISYQHAREVFGQEASYLKLGITCPLPEKLITGFAEKYDKLYVIEEGDPYLEKNVKALGFKCIGKGVVPIQGELNASILRKAIFGAEAADTYVTDAAAPPRPPVLCVGCPHRGFYAALKPYAKRVVQCGDIGCYTLGAQAPLNGVDTTICMGGGLSSAIGMAKALEQAGDGRKVFGSLGDSTFFHSGITGLVDIVHAGANVCACILDNSITAMTGQQENPGTARNLMGYQAPAIDIEKIVLATGLGKENLRVVDPVDQTAMKEAIDSAIAAKGSFVIITKRPCVLLKEFIKKNGNQYCEIDREACTGCKVCMQIGCPAIAYDDGDKKANIADPASCTGCTLCMQMCRFGAIKKVGSCDSGN